MKYYVLVVLLSTVLFISGCADSDLYVSNVYNDSGGSFVQGNCTGGITLINSDGTTSCRDISTWYWHLEGNETTPPFINGSGDMIVFLNYTESNNMTYYYVIGSDVV